MTNVSVIIVEYGAKAELKACLQTIPKNVQTITVDNNVDNIGFSRGNNLGASKATGEYLFFLNPDTLLTAGTISQLSKFLDQHPKAAIVAPLLQSTHKQVYPLQGTDELTPVSGIFALSFLNKLFPDNPISRKYWLKDWDKKSLSQVAVVPGTAFMIRKSVFKKIGGFDPQFFLFFEESDICKRVKKLGLEVWMLPSVKIIHHWGRSTPKTQFIKDTFAKSRFYYFKKHYGFLAALVVELFCRIGWRSFWVLK